MFLWVYAVSYGSHLRCETFEMDDERVKMGSGLWVEIERHVFRDF